MSQATLTDQVQGVLDGRWRTIRQQARTELQAGRFGPPREPLGIEAHRSRVSDQMSLLAATGHPGRGFPVEMGGSGDIGASVTAFEMLGHGDLSLLVKAGVQWGLFGGAVANLGTERHHPLVPRIISLDLPGCFAMTETGHGSDVQSLRTIATLDPRTDELVIHTPTPDARKDYIGNAARDARMAAVFAQLVTGAGGHGVHCVLVPIRDEQGRPVPGVTITDCGAKAGLNGVDNGRLAFDQVRVPRTNLLGRYGDIDERGVYSSPIENETRRFFTMLGTLVRGRVSVAGGAGAATRTALALAVSYGNRRRQFTAPGSPDEVLLLDYRAHQRKLLPALATTYAVTLAHNDLVSSMHDVQSDPAAPEIAQRRLETRAAGLKVLATAHATATIQVCREACGGAGYLAANRLAALRADTDVFTTFEGDNTVLLHLVAKSLLTGYREAFGGLDNVGMVRFGARQLADALLERTAARTLLARLRDGTGRDDDLPLTSPDRQLRMFADREQHLLEGLARRLRRAAAPGADAFAILNAAQDHLEATAVAHVDRVILESFLSAVAGCTDDAARTLLGRVCALHALSTIERHRAWYLEHDRLTPARSKLVTELVNHLCQELRPQAQTLVDAFGIPAEWLWTEMLAGR